MQSILNLMDVIATFGFSIFFNDFGLIRSYYNFYVLFLLFAELTIFFEIDCWL